MTTFTINSRQYGKQEFIIKSSTGYGYVWVWDNDRKDYRQICQGGGFIGSTISCNEDELPKVARNWWRKQRECLNEYL